MKIAIIPLVFFLTIGTMNAGRTPQTRKEFEQARQRATKQTLYYARRTNTYALEEIVRLIRDATKQVENNEHNQELISSDSCFSYPKMLHSSILPPVATCILLTVLAIHALPAMGQFVPIYTCAATIQNKLMLRPERTFAIIKPEIVAAGLSNTIIDLIRHNHFTILRMQKLHMTSRQVKALYAAHNSKPYYNALVQYMTSGPVIVMALERPDAIHAWRTLMGTTNPIHAKKGTIRYAFGSSGRENAVHGSSTPQEVAAELGLFFPDLVHL